MTNNESRKRLLDAYEMAWFIHRNKQIAYLIALEVACRWEIAPPQGQRTLSREQKFQRLVFEVSEYFEKAIESINVGNADDVQEQARRLALNTRRLDPTQQSIKTTVRKNLSLLATTAANLKDQTMMTYYLKHLALMALRNSRVKTVVSFTQLLYRYSTSQAMSIYEYLENFLEKSGEVKDQQYYAKARRELLDELEDRFNRFLRIEQHRAPNGATTKQITASSATSEQTEFIKKCLREFTPRGVQRSLSTPDIFRNKGEFIFQLLYPERFQLLLAEAGLATSPQPLFWPVFANAERPAGPAPPRQTPRLRNREINAALARLSRAAKRRRGWSGRLLRIVVDGRDAAFLDLEQSRECKLKVSAATGSIEVLVRTEEGDILLAHYMVSEEDFDPALPKPKFTAPLEGGRKIIFAIEPQADGAAGQVSVRYQESIFRRTMRKFRLTMEQLISRIISDIEYPAVNDQDMNKTQQGPVSLRVSMNYWKWSLALASSCLMVFLGVIALQAVMFSFTYKVTRNALPPPALGAPLKGGGSPTPGKLGGPGGESPSNSHKSGTKHQLCNIHDLYIEMNGGNSQLYQTVKSQLARKLSSAGIKLAAAPEKANARAALMIKANWQHGVLGRITDMTVIEAGLYSAAGDDQGPILWPPDTSGRQYQGRYEDVVEGITQDLIEATRKNCNSEEVLR
jgi:hypothetical protein